MGGAPPLGGPALTGLSPGPPRCHGGGGLAAIVTCESFSSVDVESGTANKTDATKERNQGEGARVESEERRVVRAGRGSGEEEDKRKDREGKISKPIIAQYACQVRRGYLTSKGDYFSCKALLCGQRRERRV